MCVELEQGQGGGGGEKEGQSQRGKQENRIMKPMPVH